MSLLCTATENKHHQQQPIGDIVDSGTHAHRTGRRKHTAEEEEEEKKRKCRKTRTNIK